MRSILFLAFLTAIHTAAAQTRGNPGDEAAIKRALGLASDAGR